MVLHIHSDASYLLVSNARSRDGGLFFLGNKSPEQDTLNGSILNVAAVGSRTRDRVEAGPALVTNTMSHQGKTYARAARDGVGNVRKSRSLLHLTSKE
jgi:hypothetical protein